MGNQTRPETFLVGWVRWQRRLHLRMGIDVRRVERQFDGSFDPSPAHRTVQHACWQRISVVNSRSRGPARPVQQNGNCPVVIGRSSNCQIDPKVGEADVLANPQPSHPKRVGDLAAVVVGSGRRSSDEVPRSGVAVSGVHQVGAEQLEALGAVLLEAHLFGAERAVDHQLAAGSGDRHVQPSFAALVDRRPEERQSPTGLASVASDHGGGREGDRQHVAFVRRSRSPGFGRQPALAVIFKTLAREPADPRRPVGSVERLRASLPNHDPESAGAAVPNALGLLQRTQAHQGSGHAQGSCTRRRPRLCGSGRSRRSTSGHKPGNSPRSLSDVANAGRRWRP
jgi:hypothetical protein